MARCLWWYTADAPPRATEPQRAIRELAFSGRGEPRSAGLRSTTGTVKPKFPLAHLCPIQSRGHKTQCTRSRPVIPVARPAGTATPTVPATTLFRRSTLSPLSVLRFFPPSASSPCQVRTFRQNPALLPSSPKTLRSPKNDSNRRRSRGTPNLTLSSSLPPSSPQLVILAPGIGQSGRAKTLLP